MFVTETAGFATETVEFDTETAEIASEKKETGDRRQEAGFCTPTPLPQGLWQLIDSAGAFWYCESGITLRGPGSREEHPHAPPHCANAARWGPRPACAKCGRSQDGICWVRGMGCLLWGNRKARQDGGLFLFLLYKFRISH